MPPEKRQLGIVSVVGFENKETVCGFKRAGNTDVTLRDATEQMCVSDWEGEDGGSRSCVLKTPPRTITTMFISSGRTAAGLIGLLHAGVNSLLHANFNVQRVNAAIIAGPQTMLTLLGGPRPSAVMSHAGGGGGSEGARLTAGLQGKLAAPSLQTCSRS